MATSAAMAARAASGAVDLSITVCRRSLIAWMIFRLLSPGKAYYAIISGCRLSEVRWLGFST